MISFTGNILFSSLKDNPIYWAVVNNGEGTIFSPKNNEAGRIDCDGSGSYSGGSGPDDAGFGNSWVPSGTGNFGDIPDLPEGYSGGGVIFIVEISPTGLVSRTTCDSGSPESFCPSDTSSDAVGGDANCPSNPIGVMPPFQDWPTREEMEARFGDSFKKEFRDYIKSNYEGKSFNPNDLRNAIADFNYSSITDSETEFSLRPIKSRLAIGNDSNPFYYDVYPIDNPQYLSEEYTVINPGMSVLEFLNAQGDMISITIKLELAFPL